MHGQAIGVFEAPNQNSGILKIALGLERDAAMGAFREDVEFRSTPRQSPQDIDGRAPFDVRSGNPYSGVTSQAA